MDNKKFNTRISRFERVSKTYLDSMSKKDATVHKMSNYLLNDALSIIKCAQGIIKYQEDIISVQQKYIDKMNGTIKSE